MLRRRLIAGTINYYPPESGWENVHLDASARPLHGRGRRADVVAQLQDLERIIRQAPAHGYRDLAEPFDEVRCLDTLEHLRPDDAIEALRGFRAALRPGGALDLRVPDLAALAFAFAADALTFDEFVRNVYGDPARMPDHELNVHRWGYSVPSLVAALEQAGGFTPPEVALEGCQIRAVVYAEG